MAFHLDEEYVACSSLLSFFLSGKPELNEYEIYGLMTTYQSAVGKCMINNKY